MEKAEVFDCAFSLQRDNMRSPVVIIDHNAWIFFGLGDFRVVAIEGSEFFEGDGEAEDIGEE